MLLAHTINSGELNSGFGLDLIKPRSSLILITSTTQSSAQAVLRQRRLPVLAEARWAGQPDILEGGCCVAGAGGFVLIGAILVVVIAAILVPCFEPGILEGGCCGAGAGGEFVAEDVLI